MKAVDLRVLSALFFVTLLFASCGETRRDNVILVIVDTLRSDHLGCYGYHRNTTPCMDSLASAGVRYLSVSAGEPWTLPSMATIFTGLLPLEHNARRRGDSYFGIHPDAVTLTEYMNDAGYMTAAFFNVIFMNADFGFHQGFDHFDCYSTLGSANDRNAEQTVDDALRWIDTQYSGEPLFLSVHFYDPHLTYTPPDSFADLWRDLSYTGEFDSSWGQRETVVNVNRGVIGLSPEDLYNLEALYDGEIAYTDHEISRLLSLIISGGGFQPGSVCSLGVSQADILPTVLTWAGIESPYSGFGNDLLSPAFPVRTVPSGMNMEEGYVVTSLRENLKVHLFDHGSVAIMFDLQNDPGEHDPLDFINAEILESARFYLATPPMFNPPAVMVENVFLDALKNLGYI